MYYSSFLISLMHVDSADVIFYPRLYHMSQMVMEEYFNNLSVDESGVSKFSLSNAVTSERQIPLVVHCEANYFRPMKHSEIFLVEMSCIHIGNSSFSLMFRYIACSDNLLMRNYYEAVRSNKPIAIHRLSSEVVKNGDVHAQAKVVHAVIDLTSRAKTVLSQNWLQKLRPLQKKTG